MKNAEKKEINQELCIRNMNTIYLLIGQYVEATQMIEGMLQGFNSIEFFVDNNYDDETSTINGMAIEDFFIENQDDITNVFINSMSMTLGISARIFKRHEFPSHLVNGIMKVIKQRNSIMHEYFKTPDFYNNWNNEKFFKSQIEMLTNRVIKTRNVCDELRVYIGATLWEDRWDKSLGDHKPFKSRFK